jgi:Zn-dependent protease with chaperone function
MRVQALTAVLAIELMLSISLGGCGGHKVATPPPMPLAPVVFQPLKDQLKKSYLELFRTAPSMEYSPAQIAAMREYLKKAEDYCAGSFDERSKEYEKQLASDRSQLQARAAGLTESDRHALHCSVQNNRAAMIRARILAETAIPVAYQNREAKLDLIQNWPSDLKQIQQEIATGAYRNRRWGDVQDIGFREIAANQQDDIKTGQDAIREMKTEGLMPKPVEDPAVVNYVTQVARRVAQRSDLHVPLHVTVLNSKEINAFALPGGFLFIERGLLEAADNESQLAGVIAHEIGHDAARHGHKLMVRSTVTSIFYQAAEVAALMLTGGIASIGIYYALQDGFYGLGLILSLSLLGVSREYELEADQLGIQYAWNSGYDPRGFINFFDKMATKEGYVSGLSWFHSHPPFYQRMVDAEREIMYLPGKQPLVTDTSGFSRMKQALQKVSAKASEEEQDPNRPSLLSPEPGCGPPPPVAIAGQQQIEGICQIQPEQLKPRPGEAEGLSTEDSSQP